MLTGQGKPAQLCTPSRQEAQSGQQSLDWQRETRKENMVTQTEIKNQEKGIVKLGHEMQKNYLNKSPSWWPVDRGYIPTCEWKEIGTANIWTEGIDFVVLDDEHIAFRLSGDYRDDGDWQIGTPDTFSEFVIEDAESWLAQWKEENQEGA